jgi:hypothetical protein
MRKRLSTCKWCAAPIRWAMTPKDRHLAVDPHPVTDGNLDLSIDDRGYARVRVIKADDRWPPNAPRWVAHWVTCPSPQAIRARSQYQKMRERPQPDPGQQLEIPPTDGP